MMALRSFIRSKSRVADFAEKECLCCEDGGVSMNDICRILVRDEEFDLDREEDADEARDDDMGEEPPLSDFCDERRQRIREDAMRQHVWEAFDEPRARDEHCGDGFYPFELAAKGTILRKRRARSESQRRQARLYLFLLLATLETDRDSAEIFERLCLLAAQNYWGGGDQVRTFLIADKSASLRNKINALAKELGEGGEFDPPMRSGQTRGDGGMDIAVFRRFADKRAGQLIGFGQCKTGHSYRDKLAESSPGGYVKKWFGKSGFLVNPVGLFFVADRIATPVAWRNASIDSGSVLFDRCRIMEHARNADEGLMKDISDWTRACWGKISNGGPFPF